jgi:hypothetical protein
MSLDLQKARLRYGVTHNAAASNAHERGDGRGVPPNGNNAAGANERGRGDSGGDAQGGDHSDRSKSCFVIQSSRYGNNNNVDAASDRGYNNENRSEGSGAAAGNRDEGREVIYSGLAEVYNNRSEGSSRPAAGADNRGGEGKPAGNGSRGVISSNRYVNGGNGNGGDAAQSGDWRNDSRAGGNRDVYGSSSSNARTATARTEMAQARTLRVGLAQARAAAAAAPLQRAVPLQSATPLQRATPLAQHAQRATSSQAQRQSNARTATATATATQRERPTQHAAPTKYGAVAKKYKSEAEERAALNAFLTAIEKVINSSPKHHIALQSIGQMRNR